MIGAFKNRTHPTAQPDLRLQYDRCVQKRNAPYYSLRNLTYDCNMIGAFKSGTHPTTLVFVVRLNCAT